MRSGLSRRDFLRASSSAGLFAASGCAGFPSILSSRSPNAKLCHACVGTSGMAGWDLQQFLKNPKVEIVALCDVDATFLAAAKKLVPGARVYADWRELLAAEGDRIDSVNVSTPDHVHAVQVAGALKAGKHVYAQKPLCKYVDENARLLDLAEKSGKTTQLGTQVAAMSGDRLCVELLRTGAVGPVSRVMLFSTRYGRSRCRRETPVSGPVPETLDWDLWIGPAPMRPYAKVYHPSLWRIFTDFGTGWVGDLCVHVLSAPWIGMELGSSAPISVRAQVDEAALADPACKGCWPRYSHIEWEMPGVKASGGKPFKLEWFSGFDAKAIEQAKTGPTPPAFLPPAFCAELASRTSLKEMPAAGRVIEGEDGYIIAPHGDDPVVVMKNGTVPALPKLADAPSHFDEYVARCLDGRPARSDFRWTCRMMDTILAGGVAERIPNVTHRWDGVKRVFDSEEANAVSHSRYRAGWEFWIA